MVDIDLEREPENEAITPDNLMGIDKQQVKVLAVDFVRKISASTVAHAVNFTIDYMFALGEELTNTIDVTPEDEQ